MSGDEERVNTLMSLLKRRGVIFPAFEIHGGVAGLFDYGPVGGRLLRKVQQAWREHWLALGNIVEIDSPTLTPHSVLEASGHVGVFNDHASECAGCGAVFRSDHLLEGHIPNPDSVAADQLDSLFAEHGVVCPSCNKGEWLGARPMNLMFATSIGAVGGGRQAYMRPETAQGMFLTFPNVKRHFRERLPFGSIQVGKGYRNEISPRQGVIRQREFNMAELEYFVDPESTTVHDLSPWNDKPFNLLPDPAGPHPEPTSMTIADAVEKQVVRDQTVGLFMALTHDFLTQVGADSANIRFRQHEEDEMAHYASDCWDLEMHGSYGWIECVGIAHRGCYDLAAHEKATNSNELRAWREFAEPLEIDKEVLAPVGAVLGPAFRGQAGLVNEALAALQQLPDSTPFELTLSDGESVTIEEAMVERKRIQETVRGEWYLPHVIEPAFGLDRIIWHLLDHSFERTVKEGEEYVILHLSESVAPYEAVVLPLFEKEGMGDLAAGLQKQILGLRGVNAYYDGSRSIGRRYARADEIGVPWAITVDHQSVEDGTVTVRRRDDQKQIRTSIDELLSHLNRGTLETLF
uniref:glycine--tRNA ligase n=1 Tax=uncultured marine group II/III euryarchaeote KM3_141_C05 TaxID=1457876 RepID=A0A075GHI8_9EURY|nr:glycyl-tRNA synthetase (GARS, glyS1) [uncultured marine group II/III euryarchaeote KM3_141_C05]